MLIGDMLGLPLGYESCIGVGVDFRIIGSVGVFVEPSAAGGVSVPLFCSKPRSVGNIVSMSISFASLGIEVGETAGDRAGV